MDLLNLKKLNEETLPIVKKLLEENIAEGAEELHNVLDRINGTKITITINVPEREK